MIKLKLVVLSLLALARPAGFCTANTQAEDIATLKQRLDEQDAELARLRAAASLPSPPEVTGTLALLCKGAGVDPSSVIWRVQAGLKPEQAVEVAALELKEAQKKEAA